jgi:hypothetical protein
MRDLPPPFFSQPVLALHIADDSDAFTGPGRLAREAAAVTADRDDLALAETLARAWRSGAPEELLTSLLTNYASAHELEPPEAHAIDAAAHFAPAGQARIRPGDLDLLNEVVVHVAEPLGTALSDAQQDQDPCWCEACIAQVAALN